MRGDATLLAYIRESAVAVVMKKPARPRIEDTRDAIVMGAVRVYATCECSIELRELTDEEVQPPVVVVVEPDRARTPTRSADTRFFRDVGKSSVAVVVKKDAAAELRDE